jgi:hypothetical protein
MGTAIITDRGNAPAKPRNKLAKGALLYRKVGGKENAAELR